MDPLEEFLSSFFAIKQKTLTTDDEVDLAALKHEFLGDCFDLWNQSVAGTRLNPKTRHFHEVPKI